MLGIKKETASYPVEAFQSIKETAQGGFMLDETVLAVGTTIPAGTVIGFDEATRKAKPLKGAVLQASVLNSATTYPVLKGHNLAVGMSINLTGGTARAITAIDDSNADYDTVTVGTTIGVAANAGAQVFVNDNGYTKAKGLLMNAVEVPASGYTESVAVVIDGTVYHRRIPPVSDTVKALMPNIIFSESF